MVSNLFLLHNLPMKKHLLENGLRINLNNWIKNDTKLTTQAEKDNDLCYKYWYYIAWKYYETLWYMFLLCDRHCDARYVDAQEDISQILEEWNDDIKEHWYWLEREMDWRFLADYCKDYEWILYENTQL